MKLAYIAGPYRATTPHKTQLNIDRAREVALKMWKSSYAVICPHMNSAHFDGECDDTQWLLGYLEILKRCDLMVLLPNWLDSRGTIEEVNLAFKEGIPTYVFKDNTLYLFTELEGE